MLTNNNNNEVLKWFFFLATGTAVEIAVEIALTLLQASACEPEMLNVLRARFHACLLSDGKQTVCTSYVDF
jgi:hypothetical protein